MTSVLFVDDEPMMREFYAELSNQLGENIKISTASGGDEALRLLSAQRFEIVVSDLAMPEMHGGEFLTQVERLYPQTTRIVLSGAADQAAVARGLMFGHRYFLKPLRLEQLAIALERILRLRAVMKGEKMKKIIGRPDALPTPPETYLRLLHVLDESEQSVLYVAQVLESDSVQAAKLLKIFNSAGLAPHQELSVLKAVQMVGIEVVRAILLALHAQTFGEKRIKSKKFLDAYWDHSINIALACKLLARTEKKDPLCQSECFTAGLLHDIGKLILAINTEDSYLQLLEAGGNIPLYEREKTVYGASHAQVGAYLLGLWGLPDGIIDAVESHHCVNGEDNRFTPRSCIQSVQKVRGNKTASGSDRYSLSADLTDHVTLSKRALASKVDPQ